MMTVTPDSVPRPWRRQGDCSDWVHALFFFFLLAEIPDPSTEVGLGSFFRYLYQPNMTESLLMDDDDNLFFVETHRGETIYKIFIQENLTNTKNARRET